MASPKVNKNNSNLPSWLTKKKIEELKKEHGEIQHLPVKSYSDDKTYHCVVLNNISDKEYKMAMRFIDDSYKLCKHLLQNMWIEGDEIIKEEFVVLAGSNLAEKLTKAEATVYPLNKSNVHRLPKGVTLESLQSEIEKLVAEGKSVKLEILEVYEVENRKNKFSAVIKSKISSRSEAIALKFLDSNPYKSAWQVFDDCFVEGDPEIKDTVEYCFAAGMELFSKLDKGESELVNL